MNPGTQARLNAQAALGRAIGAYAKAVDLLARGEVTDVYVERHRDDVVAKVRALVEAAHDEVLEHDPSDEELAMGEPKPESPQSEEEGGRS